MEQKNEMVVAEVQLVYKTKVKSSDRPKISTSLDVYDVLKKYWNYETIEYVEEFKIMLLNRANRVLGIMSISVGGMAGTIADPKVIFTAALKGAASSIILIHNHPSGNIRPSQSDIGLTNRLCEAGKFLDIAVFDHIILSSEGYLSFADEGLF